MGEGVSRRGTGRRRRRREEEEVVVEVVEDIFRAAPNQLLSQFVSVGAREREREPRKFNTKKKKSIFSPLARSPRAAA